MIRRRVRKSCKKKKKKKKKKRKGGLREVRTGCGGCRVYLLGELFVDAKALQSGLLPCVEALGGAAGRLIASTPWHKQLDPN